MKTIFLIPIVLLISFASDALARESVLVVANVDDELSLSKQEVRNLFMGGTVDYDLTAIELPPENEVRILFNTKVVGLTEARIQSYWAQMRFAGRKKPPQQLDSVESVVSFLRDNKGAIAYVPAGTDVPPDLKVVYQVE
ncbi:hypothetical protein ACFO4O_01635 [Glaciecola siphonariae]|uniref:Phosphate ABC transporter substrate-binding protein n=1 Tax=Glaciecola siphonariae TaxID=521012 RepID=A0ABV9LQV8_9ALTE